MSELFTSEELAAGPAMRTLDFAEVRREARARSAELRQAIGMSRRDQVHDEEQWLAQLRLDQERLVRWLATGKLRIIGPRQFELR